MRSSRWWESIRVITIICALFVSLAPMFWMLLTSFKTTGEAQLSFPPTIWPRNFVLTNYSHVLMIEPFLKYLLNTLKIAIPATLVAMTFASFAGYAFARINFPLRKSLFFLVLTTQMLPGSSLLIPTFDLLNRLGFFNTHYGLIIIYTTIALPLSIWMLYGYFKSVPPELEEAAMIDGCTRTQALLRVVLPLVAPGLAAVLALTFLVSWNEFTYALVLLSAKSKYTISLGLAHYITEFSTYYNHMAAASIVASIPVLMIYILVGRYLVAGLTAGAVKG